MPSTLMFEPLHVGPMTVKNRIIAPPHAALLGSTTGTEDEAERYISYWEGIAAESVYDGSDSVVLACGAVPNSGLFEALKDGGREVHVLGDAHAPRRIVFATPQGYELAKQL